MITDYGDSIGLNDLHGRSVGILDPHEQTNLPVSCSFDELQCVFPWLS